MSCQLMWPFDKPLTPAVSTDDDFADAHLAKLISDASVPETARRTETEASAIGTQSKTPASIEHRQDVSTPKEESCNLQYYFDEFFMCYTPKSQFRNWYRYGEKKDCAERWRDFKWCVSTRMADEVTSQSMLQQHKQDLDDRLHRGPNSEDVWTLRENSLKDPWVVSDSANIMSIS